ncbi:phosphate ABC transporter permease subunit PstC [Limosilactobacillus vaginalis]|jgi:phosphate transport system permease protein|uniref:Phosphate transport system permease protein n=2 Tax=Limosilactobacillus vaginalis TaxID=1633 RepID=A0AAP3LVR3_9LACO|nr:MULTISPECIES: phosphate ABC transporter permease subunit PstC [Limosilactobacillus]PEH05200.1 phosphate ABC transporter permease subunit PstC [Lactobacillus sp. UMNPBX5]EEJ40407.1 phosphate ABC transporter, permease protein PstC [Limosilactobacillus vaginalis DSM 5837 = ATCC 49540]KRM48487.1 phosphate ABC superfamily ATP binding cassette transporter, membrane protein [Limosilactobacillus vaginalis DSM 5837 = ATCC 49540]MCI6853002.1 phosphate ABC transporter permease subunit PstC [Limosilacto
MDDLKKQLSQPSIESKQEWVGKLISYLAIILIGGLVGTILIFLTLKGIALFKDNGVSIWHFLTSTDWQPSHHHYGALPMIITSFSVTVFSGIIALPLALVVAIAITEMLPKKTYQYLQPLIELLVGIPSVVYGYLGLTVIVPNLRQVFGGTGFGILAATSVLFLMILPTMTSMIIDSLQAVPQKYRQASAGLGATRWQTISRVIIPSAKSGILTAMVFGMARTFGEALAVQMVIGNTTIVPKSLMESSATLTSVLTTGIGNTVMGTASNNALWSLALILLVMSLTFNLLMRLVSKKGAR